MKTEAQNISTKGSYTLSVRDVNGVERRSLGRCNNVVTYDGAYGGHFSRSSRVPKFSSGLAARVGTGTTEILRSSSGLSSPMSGTSDMDRPSRKGSEVDNGDGTATISLNYVLPFSLGAIVGTISEVGLYDSRGEAFVAGQLIKDELGDPTTLTILADEQLIVNYTVEITVPNVPVSIGTGTVNTSEGVVEYTIWGQPFYEEPAPSSNMDSAISGWDSSATQKSHLYNSSGSIIHFIRTGNVRGFHDGAGTVTLTGTKIVIPPSELVSNDIKYIAVQSNNTSASVDTDTKLAQGTALIVEFTPPLKKSDTEALELSVSRTITI